jgi:hypothetical protein
VEEKGAAVGRTRTTGGRDERNGEKKDFICVNDTVGHLQPRLSLRPPPARAQCPLCTGDGLRSNIVLDRVGPKSGLGRSTGTVKRLTRSKSLWGMVCGKRMEMLL